jgi:hypothetical protein
VNMTGSDGAEALRNDAVGKLGLVAVTAEVTEINVAQISGDEIFEDGGGGFVAEVAVTAHDALFDTPGPFKVVLEQFHVVIGFENQNVGPANALDDEFGGMAEIGEEADLAALGAEHEAHRIIGIVGHGKGFHTNFTDFEDSTGAEETKLKLRLELHFDRFLRQAVTINRDGKFGAERAEAVRMIGVLVSQKDARETFRRASDLGEAFANLAGAETGVDEQTGVARFEIGAITVGAAAQDRELNCHKPKPRKSRLTRQWFSQRNSKYLVKLCEKMNDFR